jgi:hypothetical protein
MPSTVAEDLDHHEGYGSEHAADERVWDDQPKDLCHHVTPSIVFRLAQRRVSRIGKKPQTGCGGLPSLSPRASTDRRSVIAPMANGRARGRLSTKPEHKAGRRPR